MRKVCVTLGLIVIVITLFAVISLKEKSEIMHVKVNDINSEINTLKRELESLRVIRDVKILKSAQFYTHFITRFKQDLDTYAFKAQVEIVSEGEHFDKSIKRKYAGINPIGLHCIFFQVSSHDDIERILAYIDKWPMQYPCVLDSIQYKNNQIEVIGGLYGL